MEGLKGLTRRLKNAAFSGPIRNRRSSRNITSRKNSKILDLYFVLISCKYSSYYFLTFVIYSKYDKANTLDFFLTSNPSIYSPPTVSSTLGNSDHCLITLRHDFLPHLDRTFAPQRVFHYSKADWDSLRTFYSSYPWSSGFSNDPSSLVSFVTDAILLGMDLFIPLVKSLVKKLP